VRLDATGWQMQFRVVGDPGGVTGLEEDEAVVPRLLQDDLAKQDRAVPIDLAPSA